MRILLAHNNYSVQGGAEVFFHEVGRLLKDNGHEVAIFTCAEPGLDRPYSDQFPDVAHYAEGGLVRKAFRVPGVIYNRDAAERMAHVIADFKPDLVHGFAIYGRLTPSILDAAREAGVPVVLSCNDYKHICANYKLYHHGRICEDCKGGNFFSPVRNRCCHGSLALSAVSALEATVHERLNVWRRNVDRFLFSSRFMALKTEEFWGEGEIEIDFLRNPFDAEAHSVPQNVGRYILYFGRLIEEKGVDQLVEAARQSPEVPVVVVGEGPDRGKLEQAAIGLENLKFAGPAWGDDLKSLLYGARAVVVPSRWHENFPYVILQAFAAGKPVIGARRGGIPELVEAGPHGWLFDPNNPSELARRMGEVIDLPDSKLEYMGAAAKKYVGTEFSDTATYAELKRIYETVLQ